MKRFVKDVIQRLRGGGDDQSSPPYPYIGKEVACQAVKDATQTSIERVTRATHAAFPNALLVFFLVAFGSVAIPDTVASASFSSSSKSGWTFVTMLTVIYLFDLMHVLRAYTRYEQTPPGEGKRGVLRCLFGFILLVGVWILFSGFVDVPLAKFDTWPILVFEVIFLYRGVFAVRNEYRYERVEKVKPEHLASVACARLLSHWGLEPHSPVSAEPQPRVVATAPIRTKNEDQATIERNLFFAINDALRDVTARAPAGTSFITLCDATVASGGDNEQEEFAIWIAHEYHRQDGEILEDCIYAETTIVKVEIPPPPSPTAACLDCEGPPICN